MSLAARSSSSGNHKFTLYFKHLMDEYTNINNADATLLALWKYFYYRPLALIFLKEASDTYEEHVISQFVLVLLDGQLMGEPVRLYMMATNSCLLLYLLHWMKDGSQKQWAYLLPSWKNNSWPYYFCLFDAIPSLNLTVQKSHEPLCLSDVSTWTNHKIHWKSWQLKTIGLTKKNSKILSK